MGGARIGYVLGAFIVNHPRISLAILVAILVANAAGVRVPGA